MKLYNEHAYTAAMRIRRWQYMFVDAIPLCRSNHHLKLGMKLDLQE